MKSIINMLLATGNDPATPLMRIGLGGVIFAHGAQKAFGWFGGHGFSGTLAHFTENMGIPVVLAFLVILTESAGALAVVAGFLTRVAALGIAAVMFVAAAMVHWQHGFFMNWSGDKAGEGFEYHLLALALALALVIKGGGRWSVDRAILNARDKPAQPAGRGG